MKLTIGCTSRPYSAVSFAEACGHIAAAGYTDVAVFANLGEIPVRSDSTAEEIAATHHVTRNTQHVSCFTRYLARKRAIIRI